MQKFSYNITFIVNHDHEKRLVKYLESNLIPNIRINSKSVSNPTLKKVIEAGGEKYDETHGLSIALSIDFNTEEEAHLWHDNILLPSLYDFNQTFGNESLFFITLLENLI